MRAKRQRVLGLIGLVSSVISLMLAIDANVSVRTANRLAEEANEIARRQLPARMVVLHTDENLRRWSFTEGEPGKGRTGCNFSFHIVNLGDYSSSIVGFRTDVSFGGGSTRIGSSSNTAIDEAEPLNHIGVVRVQLLNEEFTDQVIGAEPSEDILASLPMTIDAGDEVELFSWFLYTTYSMQISAIPSHSARTGYSPVEVAYTFILDNGEEVAAPRAICYYMKP